ncbi:spermatogenesis-associated protein 24-like [Anneissia japonica]|uniref:spermatogenesis-associated protein 24-like n=1 Tax=Anneissia japonica TaxID=1529436 RepID=UPI001425BB21|nr:spermatogenesis-associated protein 24-like [Anneissia japonica]
MINNNYESTGKLVNDQLQDLFLAQRTVFENLRSHNETLREETVDKELYEQTVKNLKDERLEHAKTKAKLASETEKLQFALGEVEILRRQLQREKAQFENTFGLLKNKALRESTKHDELSSKFSALQAEKLKSEDEMISQMKEVQSLKQKLKLQKENYKQHLTESEIQRQQEAYIARTIGVKKKKPALSKT